MAVCQRHGRCFCGRAEWWKSIGEDNFLIRDKIKKVLETGRGNSLYQYCDVRLAIVFDLDILVKSVVFS